MHENDTHVAPVSAPQAYGANVRVDGAGRALNTEVYTTPYVPVASANASGGTAPIRIVALWDVITVTGDAAPSGSPAYQCTALNATIQVRAASGGYTAFAGCTANDIVTGAGGAARLSVLQARTEAAIAYWQAAVRLQPVRDGITIDPSIVTSYNVPPSSANVPNADVVLIMTARPSPFSAIAGYALCLQYDQFHRCTVGQFNWVPGILKVDQTLSNDVIESELHTAIHEIVHVLGGMAPGPSLAQSNFIDDTGAARGGSDVFLVETDPAYATPGKTRTLIVTPRVANFTATYFACPSARGMPLEDIPLGMGSHWEARVAGPELMSYGQNMGQVYVSDFTLGFLEDTGHYVVDYSRGGPIVKPGYSSDTAVGPPARAARLPAVSVAFVKPSADAQKTRPLRAPAHPGTKRAPAADDHPKAALRLSGCRREKLAL
jgi:hypothetical protein